MNPKESKQQMTIGVAWYLPEQWERVRDISTDADGLDDTYEEWLSQAKKKVAELKAAGFRVEKVDVDSESLIFWCNEQGLEVNGEARSRYAVEKLRERDIARS